MQTLLLSYPGQAILIVNPENYDLIAAYWLYKYCLTD